jgi:predicted transcriptional regulator
MDGVMGDGELLYRAAHLQLEHWNSIPADAGLWYDYNSESAREKRELICHKIIPLLMKLISEYLTARQFEVLKLCHLEYNCTQNVAANILGITQPTVSQHLNGKKRGGKNVGGAFRRIRRKLKKTTELEGIDTDERMILHFLESLVQKNLSYRCRQRLFNSLQ